MCYTCALARAVSLYSGDAKAEDYYRATEHMLGDRKYHCKVGHLLRFLIFIYLYVCVCVCVRFATQRIGWPSTLTTTRRCICITSSTSRVARSLIRPSTRHFTVRALGSRCARHHHNTRRPGVDLPYLFGSNPNSPRWFDAPECTMADTDLKTSRESRRLLTSFMINGAGMDGDPEVC